MIIFEYLWSFGDLFSKSGMFFINSWGYSFELISKDSVVINHFEFIIMIEVKINFYNFDFE
jgi:hypothetical protein